MDADKETVRQFLQTYPKKGRWISTYCRTLLLPGITAVSGLL